MDVKSLLLDLIFFVKLDAVIHRATVKNIPSLFTTSKSTSKSVYNTGRV